MISDKLEEGYVNTPIILQKIYDESDNWLSILPKPIFEIVVKFADEDTCYRSNELLNRIRSIWHDYDICLKSEMRYCYYYLQDFFIQTSNNCSDLILYDTPPTDNKFYGRTMYCLHGDRQTKIFYRKKSEILNNYKYREL